MGSMSHKSMAITFYSYSAGIDFTRQNLTSRHILTSKADTRAVRAKSKMIFLSKFHTPNMKLDPVLA